MTGRAIDLTGVRFGRITAIHRVENSMDGRTRWACVCACGTQATIEARHLRRGHTKSCGCLRSETTTALNHAGRAGVPVVGSQMPATASGSQGRGERTREREVPQIEGGRL